MNIFEELTTQADQVEVINLENEATTIEFEANKLKASRVEQTSGVAVRLVKDGRLGFTASSDMRRPERLVENALQSARFGDPVSLIFPAPRPAEDVQSYDRRIAELSVSSLVEIGFDILEVIHAAEPQALVNLALQRNTQHFALQNQAGAKIDFQRSPFSMSAEITRIEGDDVLMLFDMMGVTQWEDDYLDFARRLADKLEKARILVPIHSGKMPVIFSPAGGLVLGVPLMEGVNGKNVYTGVSPLIGKIGEKICDEKITVVDDGTLDGRYGSSPYDDEGIPHQRTTIIEQGVLKNFLYDLKTAAQSGVQSTGNGTRGLFSPPRPEPTNLTFAAGDTPVAEMIASVEDGLLIEDVLGIGQGNIISGSFSNPISLAFKIEHGQIVGRVKNASIADNVYELLKHVSAVSQETQWVYQSVCMPFLLLPEMNVVAKE